MTNRHVLELLKEISRLGIKTKMMIIVQVQFDSIFLILHLMQAVRQFFFKCVQIEVYQKE